MLAIEVQAERGRARRSSWVFHPPRRSARAPIRVEPPAAGGLRRQPAAGSPAPATLQLAVQPLLAGGEHVTAWREVTRGTPPDALSPASPGRTRTRPPRARRSEQRPRGVRSQRRSPSHHRTWWHAFYRKSFLSVPDERLQSFYWIQLYKIASASRGATRPSMADLRALAGDRRPWPAVWWNLNVQLEYWLIHGSNHLELDARHHARCGEYQRTADRATCRAAYRTDSAGIAAHHRTLATAMLAPAAASASPAAAPTPEVGNLTWALHNVWLSYRHTMDEAAPARRASSRCCAGRSTTTCTSCSQGSDGKLHLPLDALARVRRNAAGLQLRPGADPLGLPRRCSSRPNCCGVDDPLAPRWREVLAKLAPYPVDANGYMIGAGMPFAKSHRHYSHLLMVYPLYEVNWEQPEQRALIEKSLAHWISFEGALRATASPAPPRSSAHDAARRRRADVYLRRASTQRRYTQPQHHVQGGRPGHRDAAVGGAVAARHALPELGRRRSGSSPPCPPPGADVTLHDFRTQGAFLVSAVRQDGGTRWVRVRSEAGAPCRVRTDIEGPLTSAGAGGASRTASSSCT